MKCNSCQLMRIQGVLCHETGCPDAWEDELRKCKWCDREFSPESKNQLCCDKSCMAGYLGMDEEFGEEEL